MPFSRPNAPASPGVQSYTKGGVGGNENRQEWPASTPAAAVDVMQNDIKDGIKDGGGELQVKAGRSTYIACRRTRARTRTLVCARARAHSHAESWICVDIQMLEGELRRLKAFVNGEGASSRGLKLDGTEDLIKMGAGEWAVLLKDIFKKVFARATSDVHGIRANKSVEQIWRM